MSHDKSEVDNYLERQGFTGLPEEKTAGNRFLWLSPGWVPPEDDSTKANAETGENQVAG